MYLFKKIGYFTAFIIPSLVVAGYYLGGWYNFLGVIDVFLLIPLLDYLIGVNTENVPPDQEGAVANNYFYKFIIYLWVYFQVIFIGWGIYVVTYGTIDSVHEWLGFILSFALVTGGIGITVAHELGHKKAKIERFYSQVLLLTVSYMHFYIEHNKGHHVQVSTPEDPATARRNEWFFAFWTRSVFKGYCHAWRLESSRLKRKGIALLSFKNQMIWFTVFPFLFCTIITGILSLHSGYFRWEVPLFFFGQSILAFTLLELVNYVEHYGIMRKKDAAGKYERVTPVHSWNASHLLSNFFLFQLQRHSDHHANSIKRYQVLRHYDKSPQLPAGYPTMIIIALIPPLWFKIMNKRLERWHRTEAA